MGERVGRKGGGRKERRSRRREEGRMRGLEGLTRTIMDRHI